MTPAPSPYGTKKQDVGNLLLLVLCKRVILKANYYFYLNSQYSILHCLTTLVLISIATSNTWDIQEAGVLIVALMLSRWGCHWPQESGVMISPFQMRSRTERLSPFPEGTEQSDRPTPSAPPAALQTRQARAGAKSPQ